MVGESATRVSSNFEKSKMLKERSKEDKEQLLKKDNRIADKGVSQPKCLIHQTP